MEIYVIIIVALTAVVLFGPGKSGFEGTPVTPEQRPIIEEFKRRRLRQIRLVFPVGLLVGGMIWMRIHPESAPSGFASRFFVFAGSAVAVAALIYSFGNWTCPACGKYLGKRMYPSLCPHCGARLRE